VKLTYVATTLGRHNICVTVVVFLNSVLFSHIKHHPKANRKHGGQMARQTLLHISNKHVCHIFTEINSCFVVSSPQTYAIVAIP